MIAASQTSVPFAATETPFARGMAFAAYFLLLAALPTFGFGAALGLIIAYARRDASTPLIRSHHRFQIRIFWVGVALAVAGLAFAASAGIDAWRTPLPQHFHIQRSPDAQTVAYHPIAYHPGVDPEAYEGSTQPAFAYSWSFGDGLGVFRSLRSRAMLEGYAAMAAILCAGLWGIFTPLWGAARLASGRPIGHSAG